MRNEGDVSGGQHIGFVHTLNNNVVAPSAGVAVGTVEPQLLEKARAVVVPPDIAATAMRILRERRVVLLQGRPHWGKATLALWMLSRVGNDDTNGDASDGDDPNPLPKVCGIAPDARLDNLPEEFFSSRERACDRYVVDTLSTEAASALRLPVLRALSDQLGDGYLVVTVDSRTAIPRIELHDYLVSCEELPESKAVLRKNLRWRLGRNEPLDRLLARRWVQRELKRTPLPGYLDQLAEVLAAIVQNNMDEADAQAAYARFGPLRVEEWFESHPDLPERCRMVAAAVLNGASYHEVADAAEALRRLLDPPEEEGQLPRPPDWTLGSPRRHIAEDVGARILPASLTTVLGPSPSEVLQLEDGDLQREVLEHVWSGHDAIRSTLLDWLAMLGAHGNLNVSGRAAAAVGALCSKDFVYLHNRLLFDWATAPKVIARVSAAVALDVVARDRELAKRVRALLHRWISGDPGSPEAWTAVAAYGFGVGLRWPTLALRDLRVIVEEAPEHAWVASRSLANLCHAGKAITVLDAITDWAAVDDSPEAGGRVLGVFLRMLQAGGDIEVLSAAPNGAHGKVPTLLRLAASDEQVRARVVALWKQAFHRAETQEQAVDILGNWIAFADEDQEGLQALDPVAEELLKGTSDEQDELAHVLREWTTDPRRRSTNARRYLISIGQEDAR